MEEIEVYRLQRSKSRSRRLLQVQHLLISAKVVKVKQQIPNLFEFTDIELQKHVLWQRVFAEIYPFKKHRMRWCYVYCGEFRAWGGCGRFTLLMIIVSFCSDHLRARTPPLRRYLLGFCLIIRVNLCRSTPNSYFQKKNTYNINLVFVDIPMPANGEQNESLSLPYNEKSKQQDALPINNCLIYSWSPHYAKI